MANAGRLLFNVMMTRASVIGLLVLVVSSALASRMPEPALDPKTYVSESGRFALLVDPTEMHGQGPGDYRLTCEGKEVWTKRLPYTLCDVVVADDGTVAGYGYTYGVEGFPPEPRTRAREDYGEFVIAILAPDGTALLERRTKRVGSRFLHADPTPLARGVFLDPDNDRVVVRVMDADLNARTEPWEIYRLSTGEAQGKWDPSKTAGDKVTAALDARAVPGTGLTLVQWWLYDGKPGARFTLHAPSGERLWSHERSGDYDLDRQRRPQEHGIVDVQNGRFSVRFVRDEQKVTFSVKREESAENQWEVKEIGREKFIAPTTRNAIPTTIATAATTSQPTTQSTTVAKIELKHLGSIPLGAAEPTTHPVRGDIRDFCIDDRGRIGIIRLGRDGKHMVVFTTKTGELLREMEIEGFGGKDVGNTTLTPIRQDRWLATASGFGPEATARGWWIDAGSGAIESLGKDFGCPPIEQVAASGDGGFVALTQLHHRYTIENALIAFDERGRRRWEIGQRQGAENILCSPHDVTVTRGGRIALLDNGGGVIHLFDQEGNRQRTYNVAKLLGAEPHYPTDLAADVEGGLVLGDFQGKPPVWRITSDGKIRGKLQPRFVDGRNLEARGGGVQVAPDGSMWATDGDCLARLDENGVVQHVLGEPPRTDRLTDVTAVAVDSQDRIYAVAARTGVVHVFDSNGKALMRCIPAPNDFASDVRPEQVVVDGDGNIYVELDRMGARKPSYLRFDRNGQRTGVVPVAEDDINGRWVFKPDSMERWARGMHCVYLTGADGKIKRTIRRRADRAWLDGVDEIAVAPDGGLAIAVGHVLRPDQAPPTVSLYTPAGDPIRTLRIPSHYVFALAYDGTRVFIASSDGLYVVECESEKAGLFIPRGHAPNRVVWMPMVAAQGRELWLVAEEGNRVERYAMP